MATKAQIASFVSQITPIAQSVGAQYGIDPNVIIAQAGLETNYGTQVAGNNYFGIKGHGQTVTTQEQGPNGLYTTQAGFRAYPSMAASVADYGRTVANNYPDVIGASPQDAFTALKAGGWATDNNYVPKLNAALTTVQNAGNGPVPPMNVPEVGTDLAYVPAKGAAYASTILPGAANPGVVPLAPSQPFNIPSFNPFTAGDELALDPGGASNITTAPATANAGGNAGDSLGMSSSILPHTPNLTGGELMSWAGLPTQQGLQAYNSLGPTYNGGVAAPAQVPQSAPSTGALPATAPSTPSILPSAPQTVNINGHTYQVGVAMPAGNGFDYVANADGTMSKLPHVSIGANTVAGGIAAPMVQNAIQSAQTAVPAALGSAGGAISGLFGKLFGGSPATQTAQAAPSIIPSASNGNGGWNSLYDPTVANILAGTANGQANPTPSILPSTGGAQAATSYYGGYIPGAGNVGQSSSSMPYGGPYNEIDAQADPTSPAYQAPVAQTTQVLNPAYTAWMNNQTPTSPFSNPGVQGLSPDDRDSATGIAGPVPGLTSPVFNTPAPPQYIPKTIYVQPPLAESPINGLTAPNGLADWYGATPLGHLTSALTGGTQAPTWQSGGLLSALLGGGTSVLGSLMASHSTPSQVSGLYNSLTPQQTQNASPLAITAGQAGQSLYSNGPTAVAMPTLTIDGGFRNSYADPTSSGGASMPGTPISPF